METTEQCAEQRVTVKATSEQCFAIVTDFDSYPQWSPDVSRVEVAERDERGNATLVHFWAEAIGRTTHYCLRYDYSDAPDRLTWQLVEGDIEKSLDGEYSFQPVANATEVIYRLSVELRVAMPGFVRRRAEGRILEAALDHLKARAES